MRLLTLLLALTLAHPAAAQDRDTLPRRGTTVSGTVYDSVAGATLAGADVQLLRPDDDGRFIRTAVSDSLGRFTLRDVPDGRYQLGFLHPILDALGVEPPRREVVVARAQPVRADLAIPSPARLRAAICGPRSATDSSAVLVGVVRDAGDESPIAGVAVGGEWLELSFGAGGIARRTPRLVATTGADGWFALCNVPRAGTMQLVASRGTDSTAVVEVQVPPDGFLRRELYLSLVRHGALADTARRAGDGRLSGTVVAAAGARPLAGALVSVVGGPETHADDRGEWTLAGVPLGTRMLEVRAVGHYPVRQPVDVVRGAPPVRVALATLRSVLDTVRVTVSRLADRGGFDERRRRGAGRYLTAADVERRGAVLTSDLWKSTPGVRVGTSVDTIETDGAFQAAANGLSPERLILMRRIAQGWCTPTIYIDGHPSPGLGSDDVDAFVTPNRIAGIEIYSATSSAGQFQQSLGGCGSIVIWTK